MPQRQKLVRRAALTMLVSWPAGLSGSRANAAATGEERQADALRRAQFTDATGSLHRLTELTSKLVLVNLWAAWCPGCLTELPSIRALCERLGPGAVDVVMLSHAMNWPADVAYAHRAALPFRHWRLSPNASASLTSVAFRIEDDRFGLPQSAILAGLNRTLIDATLGPREWSAPEQVRRARAWLEIAG